MIFPQKQSVHTDENDIGIVIQRELPVDCLYCKRSEKRQCYSIEIEDAGQHELDVVLPGFLFNYFTDVDYFDFLPFFLRKGL